MRGLTPTTYPTMKIIPFMTLGTLLTTGLLATGQELSSPAPRHRCGESPAKLLQAFDRDGDGKLSLDEIQAMQAVKAAKAERHRQAMLTKYDKDGDGKLSTEEKQAMQEGRAAKKAAAESHHQAMLAKYDTDGDGKISDAERAAMPRQPKGQAGGKHGPGKCPAAAPSPAAQ